MAKVTTAPTATKVEKKAKFHFPTATEKELNAHGYTRNTAYGHILPIRQRAAGDPVDGKRTGDPLPNHPHIILTGKSRKAQLAEELQRLQAALAEMEEEESAPETTETE